MASLATYLSVAVATVLWGANFNLAKPVVAEMRPLIAAADRFLIAAGIMLVITYATGNRPHLAACPDLSDPRPAGRLRFQPVLLSRHVEHVTNQWRTDHGLNPVLTSLIASWILGDQPTQPAVAGVSSGIARCRNRGAGRGRAPRGFPRRCFDVRGVLELGSVQRLLAEAPTQGCKRFGNYDRHHGGRSGGSDAGRTPQR